MTFLSMFSLKNPVAIVILICLVIFGGIYSATKFKQESMPDIAIPYLFVTALYPGATPQEVQNEVTLPLERALQNIEGMESLQSTSANNIATLTLTFPFSADMKDKEQKIQQALNGLKLPNGAEKPQVAKISFESGPMMYTTVTAKAGVSVQEMQDLVKNRIVPTLQGLDGVGKVQTTGIQSDNVYLKLQPTKMAERGISFQHVMQVFQGMNLTLPLGEVTFDKVSEPVSITGRVKTVDELKEMVILPAVPPAGAEVRLKDIADIGQGLAGPETITRVQGEPSFGINVVKNADANSVEVSKLVMEQLQKYETDSGGKLRLDVVYDSANDIKKSVDGMMREGALGALFASILILLFLRNLRATFIAVISIPLSILMAMTALHYFSDITLNIMTLGGMAVAVGRVVDDSIVVIENIVRRIQGQKVTPELVLDATKEVAGAITSSTLTTVAVFAPLGLVGGMVGKIFGPFALTVVCSLLASLLVAVTVVPMLAFVTMRRSQPRDRGEGKLSKRYKRWLGWSLNHKKIVVFLSLLVLIGSFFLVPLAGFTFIPEQQEKYIAINLTMPRGTEVATVDEKVRQMDQKLRDTGHVKLSQVTSGGVKGEFDPMTFSAGASNKANWVVSLTPETDLTSFIKGLKTHIDPGVEGAAMDINQLTGGPAGPGIFIIVTGRNMEDIRKGAEQITQAVQKVSGTESIRNTLREQLKTVELKVRPADALRFGLSTFQAYSMLQPVLNEQTVGKLGSGSKTQDLILTLEGVPKKSPADIGNLALVSPLSVPVTVKDIADVQEVQTQSVLQLRNGADFTTVMGNIADKSTSKVNTDIKKALHELKLPEGVQYSMDGAEKQIADMMSDMMMAMAVAIGMVYIVMVIAFGEGRAPFAILFSLPFAVVGALLGTLLTRQPISVASMIGMLMLIGIVVTNAIVLVDRVQQQMHQGRSIRESLLEAGGTRLRPILMTAIATICALIPLAAGMGEGAIISQGLAVVVIGGLVTSTLLTLIIVPVMYEILHYRRVRREKIYSRRAAHLEG